MKTTLIVVAGAKPTRVRLKLPTIIGRSDRAKLKLRGALVSRTHCEITEEGDQLFVRDLGSSNGTFVNDLRIQQRTKLATDDFLRIGPVTFRVLYDPECSIPHSSTNTPVPSSTPNVRTSDEICSNHDAAHPPDSKQAKPSNDIAEVCEPVSDLVTEDHENRPDRISGMPVIVLSDQPAHVTKSALVHFEALPDGSVVRIEEVEEFLGSIETSGETAGESVFKQLGIENEKPFAANQAALDAFLKNAK